jgi:hypothetical protein
VPSAQAVLHAVDGLDDGRLGGPIGFRLGRAVRGSCGSKLARCNSLWMGKVVRTPVTMAA